MAGVGRVSALPWERRRLSCLQIVVAKSWRWCHASNAQRMCPSRDCHYSSSAWPWMARRRMWEGHLPSNRRYGRSTASQCVTARCAREAGWCIRDCVRRPCRWSACASRGMGNRDCGGDSISCVGHRAHKAGITGSSLGKVTAVQYASATMLLGTRQLRYRILGRQRAGPDDDASRPTLAIPVVRCRVVAASRPTEATERADGDGAGMPSMMTTPRRRPHSGMDAAMDKDVQHQADDASVTKEECGSSSPRTTRARWR